MQLFALLLILVCCTLTLGAPLEKDGSPSQAQLTFGQAFDEIVVESSLKVNPKGGRQSRNKASNRNGGQQAATSINGVSKP